MNTYTIREAAEKTGVSAHALRYYEKAGLIPQVRRTANGHRQYTDDDIGHVEFVSCLRAAGMPIARTRDYLEMAWKDSDDTVLSRLQLLELHRDEISRQVEQLSHSLERVNRKIAGYRRYVEAHLQPELRSGQEIK